VTPVGLVVAKAPVPGQVKTRLAASVGLVAAAELASAALHDTLDACAGAFGSCYLALAGDLELAVDSSSLTARLRGWTVVSQRGTGLGQRLANAHKDVADHSGAAVVQIGMDTPQAGAELLRDVGERVAPDRAVLGTAEDGGWWVLALPGPRTAGVLAAVPMSSAETGTLTRAALAQQGLRIRDAATLRDVDDAEDASAVAAAAPHTRFAEAWRSTLEGSIR
jgi:uncharacterized protein